MIAMSVICASIERLSERRGYLSAGAAIMTKRGMQLKEILLNGLGPLNQICLFVLIAAVRGARRSPASFEYVKTND